MGWGFLIFVCIGAAALLIFIIRQNIKDQRGYNRHVNRYYRKPRKKNDDTHTEEIPK